MILPPRPENHPRPESPRRALDHAAALGPHPRRNLPELDRFAPPPWDRLSPQWLEIEDSLPADHLARAIDEAVDQLDLTAANASRHRLVNLSRLERRLAELDRVLAADKTGQDPGAIPAWMARSPARRRRQRHRFATARRTLLKQHARNARRSRDKRQEP